MLAWEQGASVTVGSGKMSYLLAPASEKDAGIAFEPTPLLSPLLKRGGFLLPTRPHGQETAPAFQPHF